jgi:hypothetical protein
MITGRTRSLSLGLVLLAALVVFIGATADSNIPPFNDEVAPQGQASTASPIRWQRTVLIASGQTAQALEFAVAVTEHVNQAFPEITVEVYTETLGDGGKVHWFVDYESLAQIEALWQALATDEVYSQMLADIQQAFVAGHQHDTVYRNMR